MNTSPQFHARRRSVRAVAVLVPALFVAAACGGDDDTDDATDDTVATTISDTAGDDTTTTSASGDTSTTSTSSDATTTTSASSDATTTTSASSDATTTTSASTDGTTTSSVDGSQSGAADVLTDTLAVEGVDVFLTLLPLVGFDEVTESDQITVFAPTDEAFESLGTEELTAMLEDPQRVVEILQAHVVEGVVTAADLEQMGTVQPIRGDALTVTTSGDDVMVGNATVVSADIEFDGGVVHVIDGVLLIDEL